MYKVIVDFIDLQDDNHKYNAGDEFPRKGTIVSAARFDELSTSKNLRGLPLIKVIKEEVKEVEEVKPAPKKKEKKDVK